MENKEREKNVWCEQHTTFCYITELQKINFSKVSSSISSFFDVKQEDRMTNSQTVLRILKADISINFPLLKIFTNSFTYSSPETGIFLRIFPMHSVIESKKVFFIKLWSEGVYK